MKPIEEELFNIKHRSQALNSKIKGNKGELEAVKLLTAWTGEKLKRVSWFVGGKGDVISDDEDFKFGFNVEVKFYKDLGLKHSAPWLRTNSCIHTFMAQCQRDAAATGKKPMLMVRENGMPKELYYIFFPITLSQQIDFFKYLAAAYMSRDKSIIGFRSDKFFEKINFETLNKIYGNEN